jgi:hypothetical protein
VTDVGDPAVPQRQQMLRGQRPALEILAADKIMVLASGKRLVHDHDRTPEIFQFQQIRLRRLIRRRKHQQTVHPPLRERPQHLLALMDAQVPVDDDGVILRAIQHRQHPLNDPP